MVGQGVDEGGVGERDEAEVELTADVKTGVADPLFGFRLRLRVLVPAHEGGRAGDGVPGPTWNMPGVHGCGRMVGRPGWERSPSLSARSPRGERSPRGRGGPDQEHPSPGWLLGERTRRHGYRQRLLRVYPRSRRNARPLTRFRKEIIGPHGSRVAVEPARVWGWRLPQTGHPAGRVPAPCGNRPFQVLGIVDPAHAGIMA